MKNKKISAVILAGGTGTRLRQLTSVINKHLLPVGRYPMIFHPLARIIELGIKNINIVTDPDTISMMSDLLSSGENWGVDINYAIQHKPGGAAEALAQARPLIDTKYIVVVQGDNIFTGSLRKPLEQFFKSDVDANLFLKKVNNPSRFGVPNIENKSIESIVEKPSSPPSSYCVTGIYFYEDVVFDLIDSISRRENGELYFTDLNNLYLKKFQVRHNFLKNKWFDAGTLSSYHEANSHMDEVYYDLFE